VDALTSHAIDDGVHGLLIISHIPERGRAHNNRRIAVTWEGGVVGEWVIAADEKSSYLVTWNYVGHRLRAFLAERGTPPTQPIVLRPALLSYVRACVRARAFKVPLAARVEKRSWVATAIDKQLMRKGTGGEKIAK
jgi:hypothetical protein